MKQKRAQHAWGSNHPFHPIQNITTIWNTQWSFPVFLRLGLMSLVSQGTPEGSIPLLYSTLVVKIQTHYVGGQSSNSYFASAGLSSHFLRLCEVPHQHQTAYSRESACLSYPPIASVLLCLTSLNIRWCRNSTADGLGSLQAITYVFSHFTIHIWLLI